MVFENFSAAMTLKQAFRKYADLLGVSKKPRRVISAIHVLDVDTWKSKRYPTPEYIRKIGGF